MKIRKIHLLCAILASSLMVGCASTSTTDDSAGSEQSMSDAKAMADEKARADAKARAEAMAKASSDAKMDAMANLETVFYFEFDQATLSSVTRAALDAQVVMLKKSNKNIRLEGHADERGTREYNMALGERRANAIANYLVVNGVERYRVESISYGEERPLENGSNESSYSKNRRVELK